jgi:type IV secretion system protein VirD4
MKIRLGYWDKSCKPSEVLSYGGDAHGVIVAPTRRGKFAGFWGPLLLSAEHNCYVPEPKAQAACVTAKYRRDVLKQRVVIYNPFNIFPDLLKGFEQGKLNPIALLDPLSDTYGNDADNLAESWLPYTGSNDKYWSDSARQLVSGLAMYLREKFEIHSLPDLYALVCNQALHTVCEEAVNDDVSEFVIQRLSRFAGDFAKESKEIRGVVASAITGLAWVGNKAVADNMRDSTVDLMDLHAMPMTVYAILPSKYGITCAPWLRSLTNAWANVCLQEGRSEYRQLGCLQEFPTCVGNLNSIKTLQALGAGHGCQLISEFQDLNQLVDMAGQNLWQSWLGNAGFILAMATGKGDLFSSNHFSRMTGQIEVPSVSRSIGDGQNQGFQLASGLVDGINRSLRSLGGGNGTQVSISSRQRPYILPEEISELENDQMLVWAESVSGVMRAGRKNYYQDPEFVSRFSPDPYHVQKHQRLSA